MSALEQMRMHMEFAEKDPTGNTVEWQNAQLAKAAMYAAIVQAEAMERTAVALEELAGVVQTDNHGSWVSHSSIDI